MEHYKTSPATDEWSGVSDGNTRHTTPSHLITTNTRL